MENPASAEVRLGQQVSQNVEAAGYSPEDVIPQTDVPETDELKEVGAEVQSDAPKPEIVDTIESAIQEAVSPVAGGTSIRTSDNDWVRALELRRLEKMHGEQKVVLEEKKAA